MIARLNVKSKSGICMLMIVKRSFKVRGVNKYRVCNSHSGFIDTMENWDEEKLRQVVLSKAGNPRTTTDIVCKYFIDAIESQKFGWFCT